MVVSPWRKMRFHLKLKVQVQSFAFQVVGWQLGMEQSEVNPRQYSLSLEVLIISTQHCLNLCLDPSTSCLTPLQRSTQCLASAGWANVLSSRPSLTRRRRTWRTWKNFHLSLYEILLYQINFST